MRNRLLICYDICDAKRLRKVHKVMKGAGDSVQYSVFLCELSVMEKQDLLSELWDLVNPDVDRILIANLGPLNRRNDEVVEYWGNPREQPEFTNPIVL